MKYTIARLCLALLLAACFAAPPAVAQISVKGKLAHDVDLAPGAVHTGTIMLENQSDELQEAKLYQTDYLFFANGTNRFDAPGTHERSNAAWIEFSPALVTVPPRESVPVSYVINVPTEVAGEAPHGTYWSMLMVEGLAPDSPESTLSDDPDQANFGVRQITRYGVQIATHVGTAPEAQVAIENVELQAGPEGRRVLTLDVINTGARWLRPEVWMEVYGADGAMHRRIDGEQFRIYPGTSTRQRFDVTEVPEGTYQVLVVIHGGDDAVFGAQYELDLTRPPVAGQEGQGGTPDGEAGGSFD